MGSNGYLPPPPRSCEGGSGCARVIIQHVRIFGSQNRHTDMKEPTEGQGWKIGMKRPEQPTKIKETDYPGKTAPALVTADVVLSIPLPPQTVSDIFPTLAFDRLSLLLRRRCQAARPPRTYSTGQLEACDRGGTRSFKCA